MLATVLIAAVMTGHATTPPRIEFENCWRLIVALERMEAATVPAHEFRKMVLEPENRPVLELLGHAWANGYRAKDLAPACQP